jgi:hypothetical protein
MKLYLQQDIQYPHSVTMPRECDQAFNLMVTNLGPRAAGSDAIIVIESTLTDEICLFECKAGAYRNPEDTTEAKNVLQKGLHIFQQLSFPPREGSALMPLLHRFALSLDFPANRKRMIVVRLYKESDTLLAVQCISPEETTSGS